MPIGHPRGEILTVGPITTCWAYSSMHPVAPHVGHMWPILWSHILTKTHHLLMLSTTETLKLSRSRYIVIPFQIKSAPKRMLLITEFPQTSSRQRLTTSGNTSSNSKTNSNRPRRPWRRPMGLHIPKLCRRVQLRQGPPRCPSLLYHRQQSLLRQPYSESLILGKVKARRDSHPSPTWRMSPWALPPNSTWQPLTSGMPYTTTMIGPTTMSSALTQETS